MGPRSLCFLLLRCLLAWFVRAEEASREGCQAIVSATARICPQERSADGFQAR